MNKVRINNQIVSMRKYVKQAKVHTINKLVKQIKQLNKKKGNEEQIAKFKRKAERLTAEAHFIKKLPSDEISMLALSVNKNWKGIITKKEASVEERAKAKLICHPKITVQVTEFFQTFPFLQCRIEKFLQFWKSSKQKSDKSNLLNNDEREKNLLKIENNNTKALEFDKLCDQSEQNSIIEKNVNNCQQKLRLIKQNDDALQETHTLSVISKCTRIKERKQQNLSSDQKSLRSKTASESFIDNASESEESINEGISGDGKIKPLKLIKSSKKNKEKICDDKQRKKEVKHQLHPESEILFQKISHADIKAKVIGSMEIKPLNLEELEQTDIIPVSENINETEGRYLKVTKETSLQSPGKKKSIVDPFFCGSDVEVVDDNNESGSNDDSDDGILNLHRNSKSFKSQFLESLSDKRKFKRQESRLTDHKKSAEKNTFNKFSNRGSGKLYLRDPEGKHFEKDKWRTNDRQQFKREKWKSGTEKNSQFSRNSKYESNKNKRFEKSFECKNRSKNSMNLQNSSEKSTKEEVHPSWEAKRRIREQQTKIQPFQGKKLKFDY